MDEVVWMSSRDGVILIAVDDEDDDDCWVWYGMVWSGLRQHPTEASVKFSSKSNLFWLF